MHAVAPQVAVTNVAFAVVDTNLVVTFTMKEDGANPIAMVLERAYRFGDETVAGVLTPNYRETLTSSAVLTGGTGGNYTITLAGGATDANIPSRYLFRMRNATVSRAVVVGDFPSSPVDEIAANGSCENCHGGSSEGINFHYSNPLQAGTCVVCHDAVNTDYPRFVELGHSVHNSANFAGGYELDGHELHVTYPTYMTNCSVCHGQDEGLQAANAMPVTGPGCLSCHGAMESWEEAFGESGTTFHLAYTEDTNCAGCHRTGAGAEAPGLVDVRDFHDGLETERIGIIYGGVDLSVTEGARFTWNITEVVDSATAGTLVIKWGATFDGAPINPCNTTATPSAPVFFPYGPNTGGEGTLSMLRSYAQGDDYILGTANAPGQASAVNLSTTNTVCAGNVATTTITRDNMPDGTRAIVALQGKPQLPVPAGMSTEHWAEPLMFVRVPTPVYEFVVGTGAKQTTPRREIADTEQCLKCHVGSLYQHGNTRVDNVTMCIICHNPASSDQNNRVLMGVDATEAYDGKVGQTYEFKTMLHAIHSAELGLAPYVVYRTRGIYAWAASDTMLQNWPGASSTPTLVYGGNPAVPQATQPHNFHAPTYPRAVNDCAACHVEGFDTVPDQAIAVATTIDAGTIDAGTTNVWKNKLDDTLQGASAAACTSCHNSTDARGHAYQNGWTPQTFPNGRQTILDTQ